MFWLIVAAFFALFVLYGAHVFLLDKRYRLPPGPTPIPFLGSLYVMRPEIPMWQIMRGLGNKYGPIFTFYLGQVRMVVLGDAKMCHEALVTNGDAFNSRMDLKLPGFEHIPQAITTAYGDVWRQRRRFGMRAMRDFGMGKDAIVTHIQDEVVHLLPEFESLIAKKKPFNPKVLLNNAVSNVICTLVFGKRFNYDDSKFHTILHEIDKLVNLSTRDSVVYFMFPFKKYFSKPANAVQYLEFINNVKGMVLESLEEHRKDFNPEVIRGFPDLYIQSELQEDGMDLESFCMVMLDMFLAGTETTSTALGWTLIYLTTYPECQAKCHEAIDSVIDTARLPTLKDRANLPYIDAVMNETLRHSSFVPNGLFHANEKLAKVAGYDIPANTMVMYNAAALHRDPTYWKDPEVFNPDRWISPDGKLLTHSSHFMPFGLGPRICLGESLARVEYFVLIVSILHRYRFTLQTPIDLHKEKEGIIRSAPDFEVTAVAR